jgi:mannosyl-oligosaccharide alpha-1,3-glucosidase
MRFLALIGVLSLFFAVPSSFALKATDFKTCSQSGFCRRGRALSARAREANSAWKSPYSLDTSSVVISSDQATFTAGVQSSLYPDINFGLELRVHEDGVVRVRLDEVGGLRKRYDEAASWALVSEPSVSKDIKWTVGKKDIRAIYGPKKENEVVVAFQPLRISLLRNGKEQIVLNKRGLLHMEHFRTKTPQAKSQENEESEAQVVITAENPRAWFEGDKEDDWWEETFSTWTDSKPKGKTTLFERSFLLIEQPRSRITVTGYLIPQPWYDLWYPSTRHATRAPDYFWRLSLLHRPLPPI